MHVQITHHSKSLYNGGGNSNKLLKATLFSAQYKIRNKHWVSNLTKRQFNGSINYVTLMKNVRRNDNTTQSQKGQIFKSIKENTLNA